ncbi:UNKNOWN [Stylonychia lemnae]|uniref:Uncharacterized protein n=1 Tax=Stylonychia lemnae TaxID=5949 RepID=A0A077ZXS5_STYLE|nr:UNKNOWN [Stylonychia lemnae]|eukprot:CDW73326.1 UNKNOWN [Stylonychia lemnae]
MIRNQKEHLQQNLLDLEQGKMNRNEIIKQKNQQSLQLDHDIDMLQQELKAIQHKNDELKSFKEPRFVDFKAEIERMKSEIEEIKRQDEERYVIIFINKQIKMEQESTRLADELFKLKEEIRQIEGIYQNVQNQAMALQLQDQNILDLQNNKQKLDLEVSKVQEALDIQTKNNNYFAAIMKSTCDNLRIEQSLVKEFAQKQFQSYIEFLQLQNAEYQAAVQSNLQRYQALQTQNNQLRKDIDQIKVKISRVIANTNYGQQIIQLSNHWKQQYRTDFIAQSRMMLEKVQKLTIEINANFQINLNKQQHLLSQQRQVEHIQQNIKKLQQCIYSIANFNEILKGDISKLEVYELEWKQSIQQSENQNKISQNQDQKLHMQEIDQNEDKNIQLKHQINQSQIEEDGKYRLLQWYKEQIDEKDRQIYQTSTQINNKKQNSIMMYQQLNGEILQIETQTIQLKQQVDVSQKQQIKIRQAIQNEDKTQRENESVIKMLNEKMRVNPDAVGSQINYYAVFFLMILMTMYFF